MGQTARFQEILRRLAMFDEGFVEARRGSVLARSRPRPWIPRCGAAAGGGSVAIGSSAVCREWSAGRALAAGASEDEITDVLLAIAPVAGLGRVVCAAPDLAIALGMTFPPPWRKRTVTDNPN